MPVKTAGTAQHIPAIDPKNVAGIRKNLQRGLRRVGRQHKAFAKRPIDLWAWPGRGGPDHGLLKRLRLGLKWYAGQSSTGHDYAHNYFRDNRTRFSRQ